MIPDLATLAKRRHTARTALRFLIVLYGAWVCFLIATETLPNVIAGTEYFIASGFVRGPVRLIARFSPDVPRVLFLVALLLLERRLANWIVPVGRADNRCPICAYSLKDLKSPICPECGTNLRS